MTALPIERLEDLGLSLPDHADNGGLGGGGQGTVEQHPAHSDRLVKLYRPGLTPRADVLQALGRLGADPAVPNAGVLARRFRLPVALVDRPVGSSRVCCGFIMEDVGERFRERVHSFNGEEKLLLAAQHLIRRHNAGSLGLPQPDEDERLQLARLILETMAAVHDAGWVAQDVLSEMNVLWSVCPDLEVAFIDADSMRPVHGLGVIDPCHSVHYTPSEWSAVEQCHDSDVWKAALMCGRILAGTGAWPNTNDPASVGGPMLGQVLLAAVASGRTTVRPTMRELANMASRVAGVGSQTIFVPFHRLAPTGPTRTTFIPFRSP